MADVAKSRSPLKSILAGSALIGVARGISQAVQVVVFVLAARVLAPAEFGVYALVSAVAVLGAMVAAGGWTGFILSTRDDPDPASDRVPGGSPLGGEAARQALTLLTLSGLAVALGGGLASQAVPAGLGPSAEALAMLFSLWIFVASCADGQFMILLRRERLAAAAACQIAAEAVGLAAVLWLLGEGAGVLALAWGRLLAQGVQLAAMLAVSRTLPTTRLTRPVVRQAVAYAASATSVRVIGNLRGYIGIFVAGGFLGAEAAGFFRLAQRLVGAVFEIVCEPARVAAWVVFRQAVAPFAGAWDADARANLQAATQRFVPVMLSLAAPVFVGLALVADDLLAALLGEVWRPAGAVASILALESLFLVASCLSEPLLSVTGNIRVLPRVSLAFAVLSALVIVPAGLLGLQALAWAHLAMGAVALALTIWVHQRVLGLDWRRIGGACLFLLPLLAGMTAAAALLRRVAVGPDAGPALALALTAVPAAGLYLLALAAVRGEALGFAARALRRP